MKKRRLGRSDIWLTSIGFGGGPVGWLADAKADHIAQMALEAAWAAGIRYFDTAPYYGYGSSERRIGRFLKGKTRDDFVFSTKVGRLVIAEPSSDAPSCKVIFDYSRDGALRSIEESLSRLGLASVDIALIHDIDEWTHGPEQPRRFAEAIDGAYRTLSDFKAKGLIRAIGLGVNDWRVCRDFCLRVPVDCFLLAGRVSLLEQEAVQELLPLCAERGIGVIVGGPFNSGILATGATSNAQYNYAPAPQSILTRVSAMEAACAGFGVPLAAAALAYPLRQPAVASVIPGLVNAREVDAMNSNFALSIPDALWKSLANM